MKIAIIGSGSWGSALAIVAHRAGNQVTIWSRNHDICQQINLAHQNPSYLPSIVFSKDIRATSKLVDILEQDILLLVVPAQNIRQLCIELRSLKLSSQSILVVCAKGIEQESLKLMSEIVQEILPLNQLAILSGPNFAHEVADDLPTITSIAASDIKLSNMLAKTLCNLNFRIYPNDDLIGTQVFAAAKNVLAIATGIVIGKKLGENAKASIISRGICEINALSLAMGGKVETLLAPAAIGDIYLTCSSVTSRNTSLGIAIAKELSAPEALAEGFYSAISINTLALKLKIAMPVCQSVYQIIHEAAPVNSIIAKILLRP